MQPLEIPQNLKTSTSQQTAIDISFDSVHEQVVRLAEQVKHALASLQSVGLNKIPAEPTEDELLQLPLDNIILDEHLLLLPKRGSINHGPAVAVAELLYPIHSDSLASVIRYEQDRTIICRWIRLQRRYNILVKTKQREEHDWRLHIQQQGLWDPEKQSVSLTGPPSVPMPVDIASAESLEPFFTHLRNEGTHESTTLDASLSAQEINEPYYNTSALEFPRGVLYEDRRLDLCKMVVGPTHIGALMESLRMNTFIKHFLLGNNIIGPKGAREIAAFISEFPNRIDTWYLAGNAMHGPAFSELVDAMVKSPAVTNIWLKRNPLGAKGNNQVVNDVFRLITETPNLRTLDLDQTELGDAGVTELFERLLAHEAPNKLENLYLNGNGINVRGATAIGRYLASAHCAITSLYLSNNPIGDEGVSALSIGLAHGPKTLVRLALQSVGLGDFGVGALVDGLIHHPKLKTLDIGTSYATEDLGQAYNFLTNDSTEYIIRLIESSTILEYLDLGAVITDTAARNSILATASSSPSLLFYNATPVARQSHRDTDLVNTRLKATLRARLTANVHGKHGLDMTYNMWHADEKRWCVSDKTDVRKIDSVYRTRDMGLARRGLKKLDKWWDEENEGLLQEVMSIEGAVGPVCTARKATGFWAKKAADKA